MKILHAKTRREEKKKNKKDQQIDGFEIACKRLPRVMQKMPKQA
jgi:hypothetical protein